ncbi:MAG: type IX secretion system protein PorQ [Crocinitomicaceae bacterium]
MMKRITIVIICFFALGNIVKAQIGGQNTYQFLDLDFNARSVALGGDFGAVNDADLNLSIVNPASISSEVNDHVAINHAFYPAGISVGQLMLGRDFNKIGTVVMHLRYANYGRFIQRDNTGLEIGKFTAGDYALGGSYGKKLNDRFSIGGTINIVLSQYESYFSLGTGVDFGAMYHNPNSQLTATILARNIGTQIKSYSKKNREPLPIELLAAVSYRLPHAPFRFSLTLHDLNSFDLSYNDPNAKPIVDDFSQDTIPVFKASIAEKIFRHANFGIEILPTETFFIRLGYNFDRRQTFAIADRTTISGFSGGFGLKVKKLHVNYSVAFHSPAGVNNMLSITSNFGSWKKKT